MADYFEILDLPWNANANDIRKSFREKARKYHPDKNTQNIEWANRKFKELKTAYDVLTDEEKRQAYVRAKKGNVIRSQQGREKRCEDENGDARKTSRRDEQHQDDEKMRGRREERREKEREERRRKDDEQTRRRREEQRRREDQRQDNVRKGAKVLLVHSKNDKDSAIYKAVMEVVTQNGFAVVSSCTMSAMEDVIRAIENCYCTICLLTPCFSRDNWCDACCTKACAIAVEKKPDTVFYVKLKAFRDDDIPAALKGISGLSFPHVFFKSVFGNTLEEMKKRFRYWSS